MSPPKGYGGVDLPAPRGRMHSHSEVEDTPPSDNIRDLLRRERDARNEFREDMEAIATTTKEEARKATSKSESVESKLNLLVGMCGSAILLAISAFVWLFTLQQQSDKRATETAQREARIVVLEQDRRFEEKAQEIAQKAIKLDREERARDALVVVAKAPR